LTIEPREKPDDRRILAYPKKHIARAIMEGVVRRLSVRIRALAEKGIAAKEAVMVGGPSERPLWAALIEEQTGLKVRVMHGAFAGAMGAAILAGISAGIWKDEAEAQKDLQP
jgi:xylulokinase